MVSGGLIDHPALDLSAGGWPAERVVIHRESLRALTPGTDEHEAMVERLINEGADRLPFVRSHLYEATARAWIERTLAALRESP
jgi:hypothetical protein